jgi:uncharacterized protein YbbC (DUF1343 family)
MIMPTAQALGKILPVAGFALLATACAPAGDAPATGSAPDAELSPRPPASSAPSPVRAGIDVLMAERIDLVRGLRVGLITNHTGLAGLAGGLDSAVSTIDVLHAHPDIDLVALFGPEHGLRGDVEAGERVESGVDPRTGLPVHSLYGEGRRPGPHALDGLDALLFDIQDIGTRYYTYVWTMALAMEAAAERGVRFIVLDRPNPIGGARVQGNVLDPAFATFVGLYPVPMRHGLTAGELARYLNVEHGIGVVLDVVPVAGWRRDLWYDETGLGWVPPSPNMPSLESAAHYPGTCLFEGTNLSVGRGTPRAFQQVGAPWLDHERLARRLGEHHLPGVRFQPVTFTPRGPGDGKFPDQAVRGVRLEVTDRAVYDPAVTGVALLVEIQRLHADQLQWRVSHFDRLAGTDRLRRGVLAGLSVAEITATWPSQLAAFQVMVEPYLLYPAAAALADQRTALPRSTGSSRRMGVRSPPRWSMAR